MITKNSQATNTSVALDQVDYPSDDVLPAFFREHTSPSARSDFEILMQDPFDVAKVAISDLLTPDDQALL